MTALITLPETLPRNRVFILLIAALTLPICKSCAQIFQSSGSWNSASNWSSGSVPSGASTDVSVTASPTISATNVIGNVTDGSSVAYSITSTGSLTVGSSSISKSMTFTNSSSITIASGGRLEIWGDLIVSNNLTLTVTGTLVVHGSISMNNGANVNITGSGSASVGGSLVGQSNTVLNVTLGGSLNVTGALSLGSGSSSITSTGGTIISGSCSCTGCTVLNGCGSVALPISLLFLKAVAEDQQVHLTWATASEINFDYFILEKSADGTHYYDEAHIPGSGNTNSRKDYSYADVQPFIGRSYYRLTSIDFDGYRETLNANVVSVKMDVEKSFTIFPNPVKDGKNTAKANFEISPDAEVYFYDHMGTLIGKRAMTSPETMITLPMKGNGIYFAKFSSAQFSEIVRFIVAD